MLWSLYFIDAQGYGVESIGLYQDSTTTQSLVKKKQCLSRKKTKHIKAKFSSSKTGLKMER
jgi:hypothetical protein